MTDPTAALVERAQEDASALEQAHVHGDMGLSLTHTQAARTIRDLVAALTAERTARQHLENSFAVLKQQFGCDPQAPWSPLDELCALQRRVEEAEAARQQAEQERDDYRQRKDAAYEERNRMVAALSQLYPSHLASHDPEDASWEREWLTIVCIHSPAGQLTWHIHDSQRHLFAHLTTGENHWDGHTTPEKYQRVANLRPDTALRSQVEALRGEMAHEVFRVGDRPALGVDVAVVDSWRQRLAALTPAQEQP